MNSGLNADDPTVVAAFRAALEHQGLIVLAILALISIVWVAVRERTGADSVAETGAGGTGSQAGHRVSLILSETRGRDVLRIGFGLLWLLDGILQAQPQMAAGLPSGVIEPSTAGSPVWVQHLVNWAGTSWSYHPVQAAAATVWIQAGIGVWLIVARKGPMSRLAGMAGLTWGLLVWVFGESFGGILAPGLTWLFGAPGAALIYAVAGALIALPERYWRSPRLGRLLLGGLGLFMIGMAVLQAWPGRGFWQGSVNGQPGTLVGMIQSMAQTPQPSFIARVVSGFATFTGQHGLAVNLVAVIVMAAVGVAFLTGRRPVILPATWVFVLFCLADWLLIEDLGFFGGLGTDPNSMIPMALIGVAGYLACTRLPEGTAASETTRSWRERLRPGTVPRSLARVTFGTAASIAAIGVIVLGVVPLAEAQASPTASPILAEAVDGTSSPIDYAAAPFTLTDQQGKQVSLSSLHGKVILLTFLDPVCVTDCPLIAQEFRQAGELLRAQAKQVELVAVNVNPLYNELAYVRAFDQQERLNSLPNWLFLTGSPSYLRKIYASYGVASQDVPAGAMLGHSDIAFVLDQSGRIRQELDFDPGPGTTATQSSFAAELSGAATQLLPAS
ncbi:MAG TPA: SCO family protein [Trebonia sp.]|nr:SCO family protein [Trebonia sp.]